MTSRPDLRLLVTTDLHMHLTAHDYARDRGGTGTGLSRLATLIGAARGPAQVTLLLDNGDSLQGTPMDQIAAAGSGDHPWPDMLRALHYDAVGLGNHDFDFGLPLLSRVVAQAPCPVLCSNFDLREQGVAPHAVLSRDLGGVPLHIGLLSVLPPQTAAWNADHLAEAGPIRDMVDAAHGTAAVLRNKGCDVVIALAHTGMGDGKSSENALDRIAALSGIDVTVGGHTHRLIAHDDPKPVIMPGANGSHLGVVDLWLDRAGDGWTVRTTRSTLQPATTAIPEAPEILARLKPAHDATRSAMAQVVGHVGRRIHSFLAFCAPDPSLALIAAAQRHAAAAHLPPGLPVLSAAAPAKSGGRSGPHHFTDIPAGPVLHRHLADLLPFANTLRAVRLTGAAVADWLEQSACLFAQLEAGRHDQALLADGAMGHDFDVLHGLTYRIDLSGPARLDAAGAQVSDNRRVRDLCLNGAPLGPGQDVIVLTNNYRANGGGNFAAMRGATHIPLPSIPLHDAVTAYLTDLSIPPDTLPVWRFAPLADTRAILRTGPDAGHLIAGQPDLTALDTDTDGFLCVAVDLGMT